MVAVVLLSSSCPSFSSLLPSLFSSSSSLLGSVEIEAKKSTLSSSEERNESLSFLPLSLLFNNDDGFFFGTGFSFCSSPPSLVSASLVVVVVAVTAIVRGTLAAAITAFFVDSLPDLIR